MTPEWFTEAVEGTIYDVLSEKLALLRLRLQNWLQVNLGLYKPSAYDQYFSKMLLHHTSEQLQEKPKQSDSFKNED